MKELLDTKVVESEFKHFISEQNHPCIMARSIFKDESYRIREYSSEGSSAYQEILNDIEDYLSSYNFNSNKFFTFMAVFPELTVQTELEYEQFLWKTLQNLHDLDTQPWDKTVSSNPEDEEFSLSLCGRAFYIVGLHPNSSRMARQAPYPTIVFNLHAQFEKLRDMGVYQNIRNTIRKRDKALQGSVNPMLEDFGKAREVLQYSGRKTDKTWKCPFHSKAS